MQPLPVSRRTKNRTAKGHKCRTNTGGHGCEPARLALLAPPNSVWEPVAAICLLKKDHHWLFPFRCSSQEKHKRFHVRFTPTSASWLNMVERFFRDLTQNRLRRGVFQDLEQLIMAIGEYIDGHNQNPKPFISSAKATDILEKVTRARTAVNKR
jgi:hypothetical protein